MSRFSIAIVCVLTLLPAISSQLEDSDFDGIPEIVRPVNRQALRKREPTKEVFQLTRSNGQTGGRARHMRARVHGRPIVTERVLLKQTRSLPNSQQAVAVRQQSHHLDASSSVNRVLSATSQTKVRPANRNSFKNRPGYSQIASRLLFASLVNDIVEGVPLLKPEDVPSPPHRASSDRKRFNSNPEDKSDPGLSRRARRPSMNGLPPRISRPIPYPRFVRPRARNNQQQARVYRPQFATNQRQVLPQMVPNNFGGIPNQVMPVRRPQMVMQSLPAPQPRIVMPPQIAIPPPPQPPLQLAAWNTLPNNFIDPRFNLLNQQGFMQTGIPLKKPQLTANEKLGMCCEKQHLQANCQSMCNYDTFTQQALVSTFLTNSCPPQEIGLALECASARADHTACCTENGLASYNGGLCMTFCRNDNNRATNPMSYIGCLPVFNTIKECYRQHLENHPNIFGDFR